jgi:hypothetical protein
MRQTLVLAAIAAVALMGMSCSPASDDIFPMSVGSVWHMDVVEMTGTTVATLDTAQTSTVVKTAVDKTNLATGKEVVMYRYETTTHVRTPDSTYTSTSYAYCREDGDWVLVYSSLDDTTADTVMVTSPSVGKAWHQGTAPTEVVGQEDVTVPAGTYKGAWKVKVTFSQGSFTFDTYYWYAKGTGLVKLSYEWTFLGHSKAYTEELTSATIK